MQTEHQHTVGDVTEKVDKNLTVDLISYERFSLAMPYPEILAVETILTLQEESRHMPIS